MRLNINLSFTVFYLCYGCRPFISLLSPGCPCFRCRAVAFITARSLVWGWHAFRAPSSSLSGADLKSLLTFFLVYDDRSRHSRPWSTFQFYDLHGVWLDFFIATSNPVIVGLIQEKVDPVYWSCLFRYSL